MIPSPIKALIMKDQYNEVRVITRGMLYKNLGNFVLDIAKRHSLEYEIKTMNYDHLDQIKREDIMFNYKFDLLFTKEPAQLHNEDPELFLTRESAFDDIWEVAINGYGV